VGTTPAEQLHYVTGILLRANAAAAGRNASISTKRSQAHAVGLMWSNGPNPLTPLLVALLSVAVPIEPFPQVLGYGATTGRALPFLPTHVRRGWLVRKGIPTASDSQAWSWTGGSRSHKCTL
jgi:hypothetical protein